MGDSGALGGTLLSGFPMLYCWKFASALKQEEFKLWASMEAAKALQPSSSFSPFSVTRWLQPLCFTDHQPETAVWF